jgi:diacylglycerol kinase family enzyme
MRKAALLYNPDSGGSRHRRESELNTVLAILSDANVDAHLIFTHSRAHAEEKARQAVLAGCDTVFACGGDGTIHNIVQVLANTPVALAILPMGTANALAHDLGLPMNIVGAAKAALRATSRRIALGKIQCQDFDNNRCTRYFVIAAGAGVDAALFHALTPGTKQRMGMAAYYAKAWHLWFSYPMPHFQIEYIETDSNSDQPQRALITEMLGVRIRHFGGVLQQLAPGASLDRPDVRFILCRTASRLAYLAYVIRSLLRLNFHVPGIDLVHASRAVCENVALAGDLSPRQKENSKQEKIYVEADGELLGTLPVEITVVPNALSVLSLSS